MSQEQEPTTTRREFLRTSATLAAGAAAVSSMPTTAEAMRRVLGANDRIGVGVVGVGSQGFGAHVRLFTQNAESYKTQIVAISDLYQRRLTEVASEIKLPTSGTHHEFRKLLERKDVDAVIVATSDNWHADISVAALQAGKHVYCEKPMCKTIEEGFRIYDAVKSSGKKFQVGSQGTSDQKYWAVRELVKSGQYGKIVVAQGNYMRNGRQGEWNNYGRFDPTAGPDKSGDDFVDWKTFRKGAGPVEWDPDRFFRWRKYWAYGSGLVGDLLPHKLHPLLIAMNMPTDGLKGFPIRVSSGGGLYVQKVHPTLANPKTGKMDRPDREVPDFINLNVDFEDCSLMAMSSTINEEGWPDTIRLNKGTIKFSGGSIEVKPERIWADEVEAYRAQAPGNGEPIDGHHRNWLEAIRTDGTPHGNIDLAIRVQVMITLAERSYRENKTFVFDPKTRTVKG